MLGCGACLLICTRLGAVGAGSVVGDGARADASGCVVPSSRPVHPVLTRLPPRPQSPAEAWGHDDRKDLLRKGYDADILEVNGDVQADVAALADVRSVVLGGTVVR